MHEEWYNCINILNIIIIYIIPLGLEINIRHDMALYEFMVG